MAQQIILRRGTAAEWTASGTVVLAAGEVGVETDTGKFKIGDGIAQWTNLSYAAEQQVNADWNATSGVTEIMNKPVIPEMLTDLSDVNSPGASEGQYLVRGPSEWLPLDLKIVDDTVPELGGTLNTRGHSIVSDSAVDILITPGAGGTLVAGAPLRVNGASTLNGQVNLNGTVFNSIGSTFDTPVVTFGLADMVDKSANLIINSRSYSSTLGSNGILINQTQSTSSDSHGLIFVRSRGTHAAPVAVNQFDRLGKIQFYGYDGTNVVVSSSIISTVDTAPTTGRVRSGILFTTDNGTTVAIRGGFASDGTFRSNLISSFNAGSDLTITANGGIVKLPAGTTIAGVLAGSIAVKGTVANQAALPGGAATGDAYVVLDPTPTHLWSYNGTAWVDLGVFQGPAGNNGADGADGVGIPAGGTTGQVLVKSTNTDYETEWGVASTVAALADLTDVASTVPTTGQVLKYDGTQWAPAADESNTIFNRGTASGTTSSLANGATGPINITGFKSYALLKIQTSAAAWVRIYTSEAARIADASRLEGTDPAPGAGIIAEVITTGAETVVISPGVIGFNDETVPTTTIPCRVTNKSGSTAAITVTTTLIKLEA